VRLAEWDRAISRRWQRGSEGRAQAWAVVGAHLGDGWLWIATMALALAFLPEARRPLVWRWALAMAVTGAITTTLKFLWRRQRPNERNGFYSVAYDPHSFPSGHAGRMGTVAVFVPALFPGWGAAVLIVVGWVAWARVAIGIHYLLDVATGLAVGAVVSFAFLFWR
jgi:undecaprenyl-diphosphatase